MRAIAAETERPARRSWRRQLKEEPRLSTSFRADEQRLRAPVHLSPSARPSSVARRTQRSRRRKTFASGLWRRRRRLGRTSARKPGAGVRASLQRQRLRGAIVMDVGGKLRLLYLLQSPCTERRRQLWRNREDCAAEALGPSARRRDERRRVQAAAPLSSGRRRRERRRPRALRPLPPRWLLCPQRRGG